MFQQIKDRGVSCRSRTGRILKRHAQKQKLGEVTFDVMQGICRREVVG